MDNSYNIRCNEIGRAKIKFRSLPPYSVIGVITARGGSRHILTLIEGKNIGKAMAQYLNEDPDIDPYLMIYALLNRELANIEIYNYPSRELEPFRPDIKKILLMKVLRL